MIEEAYESVVGVPPGKAAHKQQIKPGKPIKRTWEKAGKKVKRKPNPSFMRPLMPDASLVHSVLLQMLISYTAYQYS